MNPSIGLEPGVTKLYDHTEQQEGIYDGHSLYANFGWVKWEDGDVKHYGLPAIRGYARAYDDRRKLDMATEFYIGQCELPERHGTCSIEVKLDNAADEPIWKIWRGCEVLTCNPDLLNPLPSDYHWQIEYRAFDNEVIEGPRDLMIRIAEEVLAWTNREDESEMEESCS